MLPTPFSLTNGLSDFPKLTGVTNGGQCFFNNMEPNFLHANTNSLFKKNNISTNFHGSVIFKDFFPNFILKNDYISPVDTRIRAHEALSLKNYCANKGFTSFNTSIDSADQPKRGEVSILIRSSRILCIKNTFKHSQNGVGRSLAVLYNDACLGNDILFATAYLDTKNVLDSLLRLIGFLSNIISKIRPNIIVLAGDFNLRLDETHRKTSKALKTFLETHGLKDAYRQIFKSTVHNKGFTFPPKKNSDPSRIDFFFISNKLISQPFNMQINHFMQTNSDHLSLSIQFSKNSVKTNNTRPFDNTLIEDKEFQSLLNSE